MSRIDVARIQDALTGAVPAPFELDSQQNYAAVAAVLRDRERGAEVLLIRRSENVGDPWSGHMALPGGRYQADDGELVNTARRETLEEVGLDLTRFARLLGPLELLPAIARGKRIGLTIAPFVFALERDAVLTPNREVVETLWAPLGDLASGAGATTVEWSRDGEDLVLPAWDVEGRVVWGLTYRMLQALLERIAPPA